MSEIRIFSTATTLTFLTIELLAKLYLPKIRTSCRSLVSNFNESPNSNTPPNEVPAAEVAAIPPEADGIPPEGGDLLLYYENEPDESEMERLTPPPIEDRDTPFNRLGPLQRAALGDYYERAALENYYARSLRRSRRHDNLQQLFAAAIA